MNGTLDCEDARISLGVYALGAISPDDRAAVEAHLAGCAECRSELADFDGLPALLATVTAEDAAGLAEEDSVVQHQRSVVPFPRSGDPDRARNHPATLSAPRNRRNRRRTLRTALAGAAAAVLIALAGAGGAALGSHQAQPGQGLNLGTALGPWRTASGDGPAGVHATVRYRAMDWGTQLAVTVTGIPAHTVCSINAIGPDGTAVPAGSWVTDSNEGKVSYPSGTSLTGDRLAKFVITVADRPSITISV